MLKLSIVVPIYKVEDYLPACLDSILLPGREDYEIIAVDDGSPDRSGQIAEEYAARHPGMIRVIHQPNGGLGAARNTGIDSAKGEFLLFLDSDDSLFPGALEEMLRELEQDDGCDVIFFNDDQVDENGQLLSHSVSCSREGVFTLEEYPGLLLELPSACTKLWRRRLFLESGQERTGIVSELKGKHCIRIVFKENSSYEPVIANMVLSTGAPANILLADTKDIGGIARGQMILQLPEDEKLAERMISYLKECRLDVEELKDYV